MSAGRIWAIVIVALLHALIGYAFVTGLATKAHEKIKEDLKTFDVEEPPPPEEEPPPPPDQPSNPPPVTVPPVAQRMQTQNPMSVPIAPPTPYVPNYQPPSPPAPVAPPASPPPPPPPPPPPREAARPAQHRSGSISNDDYPASALRAEAQGTTVARFTVGPDGRVTSCSVTGSSGNGALDSTTCSLIQRRFRYRPAIGADGNPTSETKTQRVVWRLPSE